MVVWYMLYLPQSSVRLSEEAAQTLSGSVLISETTFQAPCFQYVFLAIDQNTVESLLIIDLQVNWEQVLSYATNLREILKPYLKFFYTRIICQTHLHSVSVTLRSVGKEMSLFLV